MDNLRAIFLMIGSMAAFAVGDAFVKVITGFVSTAQGIMLMSGFGAVLFALLTVGSGQRLLSPAFWSRPVLLRNVVEGSTAICFFSAMANAPLSLVISVTQAVPLLVTIGAAVILREHVGPRRWTAIAVGLLGVLIMLRPWEGALEIGAIFAVGAAIGLATRDVAARFVPPDVSTLQLSTWGTAALFPAGLILVPFAAPHGELSWAVLGLGLASAVAAGAGYYAVTASMRLGDVSVVAPFRYTRLPFALLLAVLFLGERPDGWTLFGAALVIGSGLFVLWRERAVAKRSA